MMGIKHVLQVSISSVVFVIIYAAMPGMQLGNIGMQYSSAPMSVTPMSALQYSSMFANVQNPHQIAQAIFQAVSIGVSVIVL